MDSAQRKQVGKWGRDLIISVVLVPAVLADFEMSPLIIIAGGVASLTALTTWERWEAIKAKSKLKGAVGVAYLLFILGGGYWYISGRPLVALPKFSCLNLDERSSSPPPQMPNFTGPIQSTTSKATFFCLTDQ